jgi:hypothetical protein
MPRVALESIDDFPRVVRGVKYHAVFVSRDVASTVHTELVVARRVRIAVHAVMAVENALQCQNGNNAIQDQKRFMHWVRDA